MSCSGPARRAIERCQFWPDLRIKQVIGRRGKNIKRILPDLICIKSAKQLLNLLFIREYRPGKQLVSDRDKVAVA